MSQIPFPLCREVFKTPSTSVPDKDFDQLVGFFFVLSLALELFRPQESHARRIPTTESGFLPVKMTEVSVLTQKDIGNGVRAAPAAGKGLLTAIQGCQWTNLMLPDPMVCLVLYFVVCNVVW